MSASEEPKQALSTDQSAEEVIRIINSVHAKAMVDTEFRAAYVRNPRQVLQSHGLNVPDNITFSVVDRSKLDEYTSTLRSSETHIYLVVPVAEEVVQASVVLSGNPAPAGTSGTLCFKTS
ncbi:MAG TPA: hypothetical protein VFS21_15380 [Roseiflexaceae bacterium]|nr:hypothetical protein [Roseiflexaceae bacterium]